MVETITQRENEILQYIKKGYTNPQIAGVLGVSIDTIKTHVSHMLDKFGVDNRTQLALESAVIPYEISKYTRVRQQSRSF